MFSSNILRLGEWNLTDMNHCDEERCLLSYFGIGSSQVIIHPKFNDNGHFSNDIQTQVLSTLTLPIGTSWLPPVWTVQALKEIEIRILSHQAGE